MWRDRWLTVGVTGAAFASVSCLTLASPRLERSVVARGPLTSISSSCYPYWPPPSRS